MGKWTRRAFITTGVAAGGALAVGVALRPGHRAPKLAGMVTQGEEVLVSRKAPRLQAVRPPVPRRPLPVLFRHRTF